MKIASSKFFAEEHYTAVESIDQTTETSKLEDTKHKTDCDDIDQN